MLIDAHWDDHDIPRLVEIVQWSDDVGFRNLRKGLGQLDDLFPVNPIVVGDEYTLSQINSVRTELDVVVQRCAT